MKIYLNNKEGKRKIVESEVIKENKETILVKLPDGNIISRKRSRDIVKED